MYLPLTDSNFDEELKKATTPVLVDFYADWCGPCKMMEPTLDELVKEWEGKAQIAKLYIMANQQTTERFGVLSIPTLIIFKNGQAVKQLVGMQDKAALQQAMTEALQ